MLAHPFLADLPSLVHVVDDENQLMIVIAVLRLDVHAGRGHPARERSELSRDALMQSLDEHVPHGEDANAGRFEHVARRGSAAGE
jgi:hypothetical protein